MAQGLGHLHYAVHLPSHGGAIDFDTHRSGRRVSSEIRVRLTAAIMGEKCAHAAGEAIVNASIKVTAGTVRGARLCYIILPGGPCRVSGRLETHVHVLVTTSTRKLKSSEAVNVSGADDLIRLDLGVRGACPCTSPTVFAESTHTARTVRVDVGCPLHWQGGWRPSKEG